MSQIDLSTQSPANPDIWKRVNVEVALAQTHALFGKSGGWRVIYRFIA